MSKKSKKRSASNNNKNEVKNNEPIKVILETKVDKDAASESPSAESIQKPTENTAAAGTAAMVKEKIKGFLDYCGIPEMLMMRLIGIYMIVSAFILRKAKADDINPADSQQWKQFVTDNSFGGIVAWLFFGLVIATILYTLLPKKYKFLDHLLAMTGVLFFSLSLMWRNNNFFLCLGVVAVAVVFTTYIIGKTNKDDLDKLPAWAVASVVGLLALLVFWFVARTTVARNDTFCSSTFDFGIFVQMYHSMTSDFTANTTCERNFLLTHFKVHTSFIYYILVPFYALFPKGSTLLIAQAFLAVAGVIPLYLVAKRHNFKGIPLVAVSVIYIFFSGIIAPCYYEFHENAFLPTVLMWLVYAIDTRKYILFYIMSVLTCIVKEDAPLYVICAALFLLFDEKSVKRLHGLICAALSASYFVIVMNWLTENGDGSMMTSSRFGIITIDQADGFVGMIKNVLINPSYFFSLFVPNEENLKFFLQVMIPLLFLPFFTKKIHRFMLMIPFVIMNLVVGAGYHYAADIGFQYIFGPSVFLIYMAVLNLKDMNKEKSNRFVVSAAVSSVIVCFCLVSGHIGYYENYKNNQELYDSMQTCLDSIPEDGVVVSNTYYVPHCANRDSIYMLQENMLIIDDENPQNNQFRNMDRYDFFVLSPWDSLTDSIVPIIERNGYTLYNRVDGRILVYVSPNYSTKK